MKIKTAFTPLFLVFWTISSLLAGPSKTLTINETIQVSNLSIIPTENGSLMGKMAQTAEGNLILILNEATEVSSKEGEATLANLIEWNPLTQTVVAGYRTLSDDGETNIPISDLVFHEKDGSYYGLDSETMTLYRFEYAPDTEKTIKVERTRMIQKIRMIEEIVEPEVIEPEEQSEEIVEETLNEPEVKAEESASETELEDKEITAEDTSIQLKEKEDIFEKENTSVSTLAVTLKQAPAIEDSPIEEETVEVQENEVAETTDETIEESPEETVVEAEEVSETEESEKTVEVVEEIEVPVPTTKWIEEIYEEEETFVEEEIIMIPHKFGKPIEAYDLSDLELSEISDLKYDTNSGKIILLAQSSNETIAIINLEIGENGNYQLNAVIKISDPILGSVISKDPYSKNWIMSADDEIRFYSADGRLIKHDATNRIIGLSDLCSVPVFDETDTLVETKTYAMVDGKVGIYQLSRSTEGTIHHVPGEFKTIQQAVDQASSDDWILLAPGTYDDPIEIADKSLNIGSYYQWTEDSYFLEKTVLSSNDATAITIAPSESSKLYISGMTITGNAIGINSTGNLTADNIEAKANKVAIQLNGGTAMISDSLISENTSHGLYYTDATATLVERCTISKNTENGIQIDITPYDGVLYRTVLRRNDIVENGKSGIYFADAEISTQREFRIENNFILQNGTAGVEVYLPQPDPKNLIPTGPRSKNSVYLVNNTIVGNPVGVLRGGNYRMVNNIVAGSEIAGVSQLRYHSLLIRNIFWENESTSVDSNYNARNNREEDPVFVGDDYILSVRSPAKKAGIPGNLWNDTSDRSGADIGASR